MGRRDNLRVIFTIAVLVFAFGKEAIANPQFNLTVQNFVITQNFKIDTQIGTATYLLDNIQLSGQHVLSCQCSPADSAPISSPRTDILPAAGEYRAYINMAAPTPQLQIYTFQIDKEKSRMIPKLTILELKFTKGSRKEYEADKTVELQVVKEDQRDLEYNLARAAESIYQQIYSYGVTTYATPRDFTPAAPQIKVTSASPRSIRVSKSELTIITGGEVSVTTELVPSGSLPTAPALTRPVASAR